MLLAYSNIYLWLLSGLRSIGECDTDRQSPNVDALFSLPVLSYSIGWGWSGETLCEKFGKQIRETCPVNLEEGKTNYIQEDHRA